MESICLRLPLLLQRPSSLIFRRRKKSPMMTVFAAKREAYERDGGGHGVDENMIVLRMRIHDMNMAERKHEPPSDWMEWEKRYYPDYDSDICEAIGLLQTQLMNTRPSLVLCMVALLALSVPVSVVTTAYHLMEILQGIISGIHLN
ncbi:hypothetical protein NE237_006452 [Protea cynaroides]|uniref:Uncharacterized protein n=1 Tax=Protea cynaroides TaxID=273540 RepID=A0A9Q0KMB0_9MAGN|nr:hypothetical protein NE237_006452 [Protea cynaroides]